MVRIGLLHQYENPNEHELFYAYWLEAKAKGVEVIYSMPSQIDMKKKKVHGFVYEDGKWKKNTTNFPEVICNLGSYSKEEMASLYELKKHIPIVNFPLGNWVDLYEQLQNEFKHNLIPTFPIKTSGYFLRYLSDYRRIILMPSERHDSRGQILIESKGDICIVRQDGNIVEMSHEQVRIFVKDKIIKAPYDAQPYLLCKTKEGNSYSIKIQLQKNINGAWTIASMHPQISPKGSIGTNINADGSTQPIDSFLKQQFGQDHSTISQEIEDFIIPFASQISKKNKELYQCIHELNIEVVFDDLQNIWVVDVRSPSSDPSIFCSELERIKNHIIYSIHYAIENEAE